MQFHISVASDLKSLPALGGWPVKSERKLPFRLWERFVTAIKVDLNSSFDIRYSLFGVSVIDQIGRPHKAEKLFRQAVRLQRDTCNLITDAEVYHPDHT